MRQRRWWVLIALLARIDVAGAAVTLRAGSATVSTPGDTADLCVALATDGEQVAGIQNDLVWDGSCATLVSESDCRINPATGKTLYGIFPPHLDFAYRAVVLSLTDLDPIADGELYCCAFVVEAAPGTCCAVGITQAGAADPRGNALSTLTTAGDLCVGFSAATPTPTPNVHIDAIASGGDGCQVAAPDGAGRTGRCLGLVALLALALRRRPIGRRARKANPPGAGLPPARSDDV